MEHYTPKHPLPEEIKAMERDDTVCQFCGVSYLIHTEIKALEDKLAKAEAELAKLKGCEENEKRIQDALNVCQNEKNLLQAQLQDRDSLMALMQSDVDKKLSEMTKLIDENKQLNDVVAENEAKALNISRDNKQLRQVIAELLSSLKHQKGVILSIKQDLHDHKTYSESTVQGLNNYVSGTVTEWTNKELKEQSMVKRLTEDISKCQSTIEELSVQLSQAKNDLSNSNQLSKQVRDITLERDEAVVAMKQFKEDMQILESECRRLNTEIERCQNNYREKDTEFEAVSQQFNLSQQTSKSRIATMDREISYGQDEIQRFKSLYEQLVRENESAKQKQIEREKAAARSQDETEDMRSKLDRVLGDLEALKHEREQMITAHHNRIEDLRESFKKKMSEADKWPEKMEKALQRERSKHQAELSALEHAMKENFVMEMEIEKQKHQKLLDKFNDEMKSEVTRLKGELRSQAGSQSEINSLKQQLQTRKADAQGSEARLRSEIESLKSIINNLEARLGKLDTGDQELVLELRSLLSDKERALEDRDDKIKTQDIEIDKLKEQLRILQDTVSRECEERMELIDALGEAREQLLQLKKPPGGYGSSRNSSPKVPASLPPKSVLAANDASRALSPQPSSRSSARSEELILFKRSANQNTSQKPVNIASSGGSGSAGSGGSNDSAVTNGNVKTFNFQPGDSKPKPIQALRAMDNAQKKRIAAILSRTKQ